MPECVAYFSSAQMIAFFTIRLFIVACSLKSHCVSPKVNQGGKPTEIMNNVLFTCENRCLMASPSG